MQIQVFVQPWAKQDRVEKQIDLLDNEIYKVRTRAKPIDGEANEAVRVLLVEYFGVKKYHVQLLSGWISRRKIFEISYEREGWITG
jgi:uncharacterized protein